MNKEEITDYEQLYDSGLKCRANVSWKPGTKSYILNLGERSLDAEQKFRNGTWKNGNPRGIIIRYPKYREGLSIPFKDRVYQRSLNDNELYPVMTKSFIFDNCACQKNKGTDFARKRIKKHIRNYYINHGRDGYVVQIDIKGYYANMRHDVINEIFSEKLPPDVLEMVTDVLDFQYSGDVGYNPGSQMVQIAGISCLNKVDHYIKEVLRVKHYIRYMDDIWILVEDKETAETVLAKIRLKLEEIGFDVHPKKTTIKPLSKGFRFLGFDYRLTQSGKIVMTLNSENIHHERKKLFRMVHLVREGLLSRDIVEQSFQCWRENASHGNSYKLITRMEKYYSDLWRCGYAETD